MSAFEAPAARTALPLYLLSLGGLAACLGASLLLTTTDWPLSIALPVALVSLLANAASILAMLRACSAAAASLRSSAGLKDEAPTGRGLTGLVRAVHQVEAAFGEKQREIERLNHADPLTGLGNRRWLQIVASRAFAEAEANDTGLSALILRVDRLQEINQLYGNDAGDRALLSCADMLRRLVRRGDSVARVSGNEFALLLPGTRGVAAEVVARRIAECLAAFPQSLLGDAPLTTRISVAEWRGEKMMEPLLARAQAGQIILPTAEGAGGPAPMVDEAVSRGEMALVGVRPSSSGPSRPKRRRTSDR